MFRRRHRNGKAAESLAEAERARLAQQRKAEAERRVNERLARLAEENDIARRLRHALGG